MGQLNGEFKQWMQELDSASCVKLVSPVTEVLQVLSPGSPSRFQLCVQLWFHPMEDEIARGRGEQPETAWSETAAGGLQYHGFKSQRSPMSVANWEDDWLLPSSWKESWMNSARGHAGGHISTGAIGWRGWEDKGAQAISNSAWKRDLHPGPKRRNRLIPDAV